MIWRLTSFKRKLFKNTIFLVLDGYLFLKIVLYVALQDNVLQAQGNSPDIDSLLEFMQPIRR